MNNIIVNLSDANNFHALVLVVVVVVVVVIVLVAAVVLLKYLISFKNFTISTSPLAAHLLTVFSAEVIASLSIA